MDSFQINLIIVILAYSIVKFFIGTRKTETRRKIIKNVTLILYSAFIIEILYIFYLWFFKNVENPVNTVGGIVILITGVWVIGEHMILILTHLYRRFN
jgi:hypothetical protein